MSDSTGAEQDGAAQTVDKARFDGLMASFNREKARADALEAKYGNVDPDQSDTAQDQGANDDPGDSQPADELEEGAEYVVENGQLVRYVDPDPGTPEIHREARSIGGRREPTFDELQAKLDMQYGKPTRGSDPWAHIAD